MEGVAQTEKRRRTLCSRPRLRPGIDKICAEVEAARATTARRLRSCMMEVEWE